MMEERDQQPTEIELPRIYLFGDLPEGCELEADYASGTAD